VTANSLLRESAPLTQHSAEALIRSSALTDSTIGRVGLEVETHLVDFDRVEQRVGWERISAVVPEIARASGPSAVTLEPGGQVELSGPPQAGIVEAVELMRADVQRVRLTLAEHRLGLAHVGADPLRAPGRVNPRPRYAAMEQHFAGLGLSDPGRTMMCSTAALQVNLDAGPQPGWGDRLRLAHQLGPTLLAISACSPWLAGRPTGYASARELAWSQLGDRPRDSGLDPLDDWVQAVLRAPVMFVRTPDQSAVPITRRIAFRDWLGGRIQLDDRRPVDTDLHAHLSTLFPAVRLRGYLEIRYLDISEPRWWPAIAALTTVLLDDPVAADGAREATEHTADRWDAAARIGMHDRLLRESARRCLALAIDRVPRQLTAAVADLAELVDRGSSPGDLVAERISEIGPRGALEEMAHA
jgi:glutamate--cysteine ligase